VLAACGSDGKSDSSSDSSTTTKPGNELTGVHWILGDDTGLGVPTDGVVVTADFAAGRMSGNSGCNSYSTPYTGSGDSMTLGPVVGTRMACEPTGSAVESAFLALLPKVKSYKVTESKLELLDVDGKTILTFDTVDGSEAIVGSWEATGYYTGSAITSVIGGSTLTADFTAKEVQGESGCNTFGGSYEINGQTIKLGPLRSTLKACTDPALQTQEQQYTAALEMSTTFLVSGDLLELFRADGGIAATFQKRSS
jgi:heat shock protein HslJ